MDEHENSVAIRVTNAPEPYDGFGTRTIEVLPVVAALGRPPYRRVAIRRLRTTLKSKVFFAYPIELSRRRIGKRRVVPGLCESANSSKFHP